MNLWCTATVHLNLHWFYSLSPRAVSSLILFIKQLFWSTLLCCLIHAFCVRTFFGCSKLHHAAVKDCILHHFQFSYAPKLTPYTSFMRFQSCRNRTFQWVALHHICTARHFIRPHSKSNYASSLNWCCTLIASYSKMHPIHKKSQVDTGKDFYL